MANISHTYCRPGALKSACLGRRVSACGAAGVILLLILSGRATGEEHSPEFDFELRERLTFLSSLEWDDNNEESGWFWTQRLAASAQWQGESVGGKVTLLSGWLEGIHSNPIEENQLDIHEAYFDVRLGEGTLRVGRQELQLGSQRLVGTRDGTNIRRTWDGMRYSTSLDGWNIDALYAQEVRVAPEGVFNDDSTSGRALTGVYATGSLSLTNLDVYYLASIRDGRSTIEGIADQRRHTLGTRIFGEQGPVFWNWEAAIQLGRHGDDDIRAWTLATNTGYRWSLPWSPSVMLSANVASGDSSRGDGRLETFDALYPRGSYFSEIAQIGPSNFFNLNPYLNFEPMDDLAVSIDLNWFWRKERNDGVYGPPGNIVRRPGESRASLVSTAVSGSIEWDYSDNLLLGIVTTYSDAGTFIEQTGPSDSAFFSEFKFEMKF